MLIECPDCKRQVSDQAANCPHCGHPIKPTQPLAVEIPKTPSKKRHGCLTALGVFGILAIIGSLLPEEPKGTGPHSKGCRDDWTKCADNADLANNYQGWMHVKSECKEAATQQARFGTPEWPWLAFSSFYSGSNYVQSGIVFAIEKDAQFSNAFGAMVHSIVKCEYDLRAGHVVNVEVMP